LAAYRIAPTVDARSALVDTTAHGVVNRIVGASGPTTLQLNPAGTVLAVSNAGNGTVTLYGYRADQAMRRLGVVPTNDPADQVFAVAFSPDGRTLAVGGLHGHVRLFDVSDPQRPAPEANPSESFAGAVESLAFSPTGDELVAGGAKPPLRQWATTDPHHPTALPTPGGVASDGIVQGVAFSPDGATLAAAGVTGTTTLTGMLWMWRATDVGAPPTAMSFGSSAVNFVVYAADGHSVAVGTKDSHTLIIDVSNPASPTVVQHLNTGFTSWANAASFSPNGRLLAIGGSDGTLDVFDTSTWSRLEVSPTSSQVTAVRYAPDGRMLLTASADGTVRSWPARDGSIAMGAPVFAVAYDRSGTRFAVASSHEFGHVSIWSTRPSEDSGPTLSATLMNPATFGPSDGTVAISADGKLVVTGNGSGQVLVATIAPGGIDPASLPS
jgi:WD40 repeat protein